MKNLLTMVLIMLCIIQAKTADLAGPTITLSDVSVRCGKIILGHIYIVPVPGDTARIIIQKTADGTTWETVAEDSGFYNLCSLFDREILNIQAKHMHSVRVLGMSKDSAMSISNIVSIQPKAGNRPTIVLDLDQMPESLSITTDSWCDLTQATVSVDGPSYHWDTTFSVGSTGLTAEISVPQVTSPGVYTVVARANNSYGDAEGKEGIFILEVPTGFYDAETVPFDLYQRVIAYDPLGRKIGSGMLQDFWDIPGILITSDEPVPKRVPYRKQ